jgi:flagellar biosynthesis protein FlhF
MQIKRFEAKDMTTALRLIKAELGPEAVILSARNIKKANSILGLARSLGVEVTAAVDAYHLPAAVDSVPHTGGLNGYGRHTPINGGKKGSLRASGGNRVKTLTYRGQTQHAKNRIQFESHALGADIFQHMLFQEINRDIANEVTQALTEQYPGARFETKAEIISKLSKIFRQKIERATAPVRVEADSRVIAFIGPTGAGKTTTIAKLAAQQAIELKKKVAIISIDSYRIGAVEPLKVYARALAIPLKTATSVSAFRAALDEFRNYDLILVDSPGFNPEKQTEINDLKAYLQCQGSIAVHLVLSATTKESDLGRILKRREALGVHQLIFTKLDESRTYGNLINLLTKHPLPLSFLTNGREVPEAIETGSLEGIVEYAFESFTHATAHSPSERSGPAPVEGPTACPEDGCFVANKNSDLFHQPDCTWARKIKSKNRITFLSPQAAQQRNFMPCRDCQPLQCDEPVSAGLTMGDHMRTSNDMLLMVAEGRPKLNAVKNSF